MVGLPACLETAFGHCHRNITLCIHFQTFCLDSFACLHCLSWQQQPGFLLKTAMNAKLSQADCVIKRYCKILLHQYCRQPTACYAKVMPCHERMLHAGHCASARLVLACLTLQEVQVEELKLSKDRQSQPQLLIFLVCLILCEQKLHGAEGALQRPARACQGWCLHAGKLLRQLSIFRSCADCLCLQHKLHTSARETRSCSLDKFACCQDAAVAPGQDKLHSLCLIPYNPQVSGEHMSMTRLRRHLNTCLHLLHEAYRQHLFS